MGATLCPLFDLIVSDIDSYKDLMASFVNILKQIAERRLPKSYDYHQISAPFIQVESYLQIMGELKLPSAFLQIFCWVLGEYGTLDGKYSAAYITGKLCDIAEAHSSDDIVKAYATTALMKIYSFEIAAGRKVDILPECQSLIEEMLVSNSTDLQQRAYELQGINGLNAQAVKNIIPVDSTCEEIEIDKNLSFLDDYIQQSMENGAQPYIPESERLGTSIISNFISQENEWSAHALKFEAYELPKPLMPPNFPPVLTSSTELVPVPEVSYTLDVQQPTTWVSSTSNSGSVELKLRLEGVQKKWGRPTSSSPAPSAMSTDTVSIQNEVNQPVSVGTSNTKASNVLYDSRKQEPEVSAEKQKLAASLFGGAPKSDRKLHTSSLKDSKNQHHRPDKSRVAKIATSDTTAKSSNHLQI